MSKKIFFIFIALFILIALSGLIGWQFYTPPAPDHRLILVDPSISSTNNSCTEITKLAEIELRRQPTSEKTKLVIILNGDDKTANEPRAFGSYDVPLQVKLTEGNSVVTDKKNKIFEDIKAKCGQFSPALVSSVFMGFRRAVEHLQSLGCNEHSKCEILAQTDLQENADPEIKAAISGASTNLKNLPAPINNQGISIKICGISQTKGTTVNPKGEKTRLTANRDSARADRIQEVWKRLFTHPELITFAPYCSE